MSEVLEKATVTITEKMGETTFSSSVKFKIEEEGSIVVDSDGARVSEEDTDCTLIASLETFSNILSGDINATEAYMTGSLKVEGSMSAAMELSSILS
jgi:putative sterol carrier protein